MFLVGILIKIIWNNEIDAKYVWHNSMIMVLSEIMLKGTIDNDV
jgi:hypothetical protein